MRAKGGNVHFLSRTVCSEYK